MSAGRQSRLAASWDPASQFPAPQNPHQPYPYGQNPHIHAPNQYGIPGLQFRSPQHRPQFGPQHRPQFGPQHRPQFVPQHRPQFGPQHPPPPFEVGQQSHVPPPYATFGVRPAPPPQHPPPPPPLPHGKRRLEEEAHSDSVRNKRVKEVKYYIRVLDFLAQHPPTVPYHFNLGSTFGDIPQGERVKTTTAGVAVLDGSVGFLFGLHALDLSFGGDFDPSDILVSEQTPCDVMIKKPPTKPATWLNMCLDLERVVAILVLPRYGKDGDRPAYIQDFVSRVEALRAMGTPQQWQIRRWVIRNHPTFVESGKRRLLIEDFYKFYKTLDPDVAEFLFRRISGKLYERWQVLIAPIDNFLSTVYWKGREDQIPEGHFDRNYVEHPHPDEENFYVFAFTSEHGYLAVFLRHFLVHGPEEAMLCTHGPEGELWRGVGLEEMDFIIAHYFEEFLSAFLDELWTIADKFEMVSEMLTIYAERRSASRQVDG